MILDLIKSNDQLITELNYTLINDYNIRKKEFNYLNKSRIEVWEKKGEKIDSLYKLIYEQDYFLLKNQDSILLLDSTANAEVFKILRSNTIEKYVNEQIDRDSLNFFKNDSLAILKIYKSTFTDAIKSQLLKNYFRKKSYDYQNYCNALSPHLMKCLTYLKYSYLCSVDKNILLPGQKLTAQVGVGEITRNSSPRFYINNKFIESDLDGIARLSIKVNSKKGKYKIPIKVVELSEDGSLVTHTKEIEYEVVDTICK